MSGAIGVVMQVFDGLFALAFIAGAFLLWSRSKTAAILGASAGAVQFLVFLAFLVIDLVGASGPSAKAIRLIHVLLSGCGNFGFYALLVALVLVLAKSNEAAR